MGFIMLGFTYSGQKYIFTRAYKIQSVTSSIHLRKIWEVILEKVFEKVVSAPNFAQCSNSLQNTDCLASYFQ